MNFGPQTYINSKQVPLYLPLYWNSCMYFNFPPLSPACSQITKEQATLYMQNYPEFRPNAEDRVQKQSTKSNQKSKNLENKSQFPPDLMKSCYISKKSQGYKQQVKKQIKSEAIQSRKQKINQQDEANEASQALNQIGKSNWTNEEQQKLKQLVNLFGKRWKYISEHFPNRTGKQIRQRYLNYLRPNLSLKKWSQEEDKQIMQLVLKYGRSWRTIEKKLKNRSQNQIKNRYYGHLHKVQKIVTEIQQEQKQAKIKKQQTRAENQIYSEILLLNSKIQN